jgi:trigger factor
VQDRKLNILIHTEDEGSPPDEWPFPGFNQDLMAAAVGDVREVEYDFPDDEASGIFRGKSVRFFAHVDEVVSRELPELDDAFAQSVGEFSTVDELKEYVSTGLRESAAREYDSEYNEKILDKIVEISSIDFPPQMVEHELGHMLERFESQLASMGIDLEIYLKTRGMSREDLELEMKPDAETRIRRSLALMEFINREKFEISQTQVQTDLNEAMEMIAQSDSKPAGKQNTAVTREELQSRLISRHIEREAFAKLKSIASGEYEKSSRTSDPAGSEPEERPDKAVKSSSKRSPAKGKKVADGTKAPKKAKKSTKAEAEKPTETEIS